MARQSFSVNFAVITTDRQRYIDGGQLCDFEGEDQPAQGWRIAFSFHRPRGSERPDEGDLTIMTPDGGELYGTFVGGEAAEITDEGGAVNAERFDLRFDVSGGEGSLAGTTGAVHIAGTYAGEGTGTGGTYEGEGALLTADLDLETAADLTPFRPERHIPTTPDEA